MSKNFNDGSQFELHGYREHVISTTTFMWARRIRIGVTDPKYFSDDKNKLALMTLMLQLKDCHETFYKPTKRHRILNWILRRHEEQYGFYVEFGVTKGLMDRGYAQLSGYKEEEQ